MPKRRDILACLAGATVPSLPLSVTANLDAEALHGNYDNWIENVQAAPALAILREVRSFKYLELLHEPTKALSLLRHIDNAFASAANQLQSFNGKAAAISRRRHETVTTYAQFQAMINDAEGVFNFDGVLLLEEVPAIVVPPSLHRIDFSGATLIRIGGGGPILKVRNDCLIIGGAFYSYTPHGRYGDSPCIYLDKSTNCSIVGGHFATTGNSAIYGKDCTGVLVMGNSLESLTTSRPKNHSDVPHDILFWGRSSDNVVARNRIITSNGIGIFVQVGAGQSGDASKNAIIGNTVVGAREYGISVYSKVRYPKLDSRGTLVLGNRIDRVYGDVVNGNAKGNIYGSGIYIQAFHETILALNIISDTCLQSTEYLLGPGGISVNNDASALIAGNIIRNSRWYGIYIKDTTNADHDGRSVIFGNIVTGSGKANVRSACIENLEIKHNSFDSRSTSTLHEDIKDCG